MAIINNAAPAPTDSGNGMGFLIGIVLFIVFLVILIYYILPQFTTSLRGPQINVPGQIDVNVKQK